MRAGDVRAQLLEVGHDAIHVGLAERRAAARHVLVDRGSRELDLTVVEQQAAALDLHRAQAHPPPDHLLDDAPVAQRQLGRVELRVLGPPQLGRRHLDREGRAPALGTLPWEADHAPDQSPAGRTQLHLERGPQLRYAALLEHSVDQQLGPAAAGRPAALHARHGPQVLQMRPPGRDQADRPHDAAPVPPALGQPWVLAAVDDHHQLVRPPRTQAARLEGEWRVGVGVLAQAAAVEKDHRAAAHALEAHQPAKAARRGGAGEAQPVAAHAARVLRGHGGGVEHAGHRHRAPGLQGPEPRAARSGRGGVGNALGLSLHRGRRLRRSRGGLLPADLPAAFQRLRRGRLGRHGRAGKRRKQRRECESPPHAPSP